MRRISTGLGTLIAMVGILAACDSATEPPASSHFRGIIAWDDPPVYALSQASSQHVSDTTGLEPGSPPTIAVPGLQAPDTVDAGVPFSVRVTTVLPNGCWEAGGVESSIDGNAAILEVYDQGPVDPHRPCILIAAFPAREVELRFDEPGEANIRLIGRRVWGQAYDQHEIVEQIERSVVVR